jgi:hypothetical protein
MRRNVERHASTDTTPRGLLNVVSAGYDTQMNMRKIVVQVLLWVAVSGWTLARVALAQGVDPPAVRPPDALFNLGPLGARCRIIHDDSGVLIELVEVDAGAPLARAGARVGMRWVGVARERFAAKVDPLYQIASELELRLAGKAAPTLVIRGQNESLAVTCEALGARWESALQVRAIKALSRLQVSSSERMRDPSADPGSFPTAFNSVESKVAAAAMVGLALIAAGGGPSGEHAPILRGIATFISSAVLDTSRIAGGANTSQANWCLGFGALFLAEYIAHKDDKTARRRLEEVVNRLVANQEANGGWAHGPGGANALGYTDFVAVTAVCLAGLGGARRIGITVDPGCIRRAQTYIEGTASPEGAIGYSMRAGQVGMPEPGRAGATLVAWSALMHQDDLVTKTKAFLTRELAGLPEGHASPMYHMAFGAWGSSIAGCSKPFLQMYRREILLAMRHDGSFFPRPSRERLETDRMMGEGWVAGAYLLAWSVAEQNRFKLYR